MMGGILAVLFVFDLALLRVAHLTGIEATWAVNVPVCYSLIAVCCCPWWKLQRITEAVAIVLWAELATTPLSVIVQAAGRTPSPLADASLARIDGTFGVSIPAIIHWVSRFPVLHSGLAIVYTAGSLCLIFAGLIVPVLIGKAEDSRRFLLGAFLASLIAAGLFALWPAVGPWTVYSFAPSRDQATVGAYLHLLKAGSLMRMSFDSCGFRGMPISVPN
jgi:hypothetical protein